MKLMKVSKALLKQYLNYHFVLGDFRQWVDSRFVMIMNKVYWILRNKLRYCKLSFMIFVNLQSSVAQLVER